ncbi:MAG TPA: AAA family ATPase [Pyrinomonadaceae bacterium]
MTELIIVGLVVLCLLLLGVVWYFVLGFRVRETGGELERVRAELKEARATLEELRDARREIREAVEQARSVAQQSAADAQTTADAAEGADSLAELHAADANAAAAAPEPDSNDVFSLAWAMDDYFNRSAYPSDLLVNEHFQRGVEILKGPAYSASDLLSYARGGNVVVSCMALEALSERENSEGVVFLLIDYINGLSYWPRFYAMRALAERAGPLPMVTVLLLRLNATWTDYISLNALRDFLTRRMEIGEEARFGNLLSGLDEERSAALSALMGELRGYVPAEMHEEFERWQRERVDTEFLKSFGRVWDGVGAGRGAEDGVVMLPAVEERLTEMLTALGKDPPRSVMLVGESGTGKTTLTRVLARRLQREGWTIFEASAADLIAGQKYIGEIEGRAQTFVRQIGGKRVLWVVPSFQELLWAGRHQYSPTGVLDLVMPQIESGAIKVVGELTSVAYENLVRQRPKLRAAMQTVRVAPMPDAETFELGRRWAELHAPAEGDDDHNARVSPETLREAFQLTKQYLNDKAAPGNLILLLDSTHRRLVTEQGANRGQISLDDLLVTLSQLTGLPTQILDDRAGLDLSELRAFFERRVMGQTEAVDCLVERVAMVKAGLTDPTRPQGVFLFVGPTGTGKTEIAKTLAEFLFGSPERLIRLDMSEFQTSETLDRILGETTDAGDSTALVNSIRKQPFSVILLDEFEKAHPNVWDLFLQVFDDGRLTDRRGATADFRHCVLIMTSNLGATLPTGASIGFSHEQAQFTSGAVERAVGRSFRREFINRIDRVVVFRPLSLSAMRDILRKELNDVLGRRGFRTRQWAVEWDESAIDFLLQKGFTADLGARPLKRSVERYLLSPLSLTIVNHQFPEGDQFLLVRAGGDDSIEVEFVDPDAPESPPAAASVIDEEEAVEESAERRLESIALDARGTGAEVSLLQSKYDELRAQVDSDEWQQRKQDALLQTARPGFWDSPERFGVLGLAEYMDRIEAGLDTAGSLLARLTGGRHRADERRAYLPDLVERVAQQLYLVDAACCGMGAGAARDAFLLVAAVRETGADAPAADRFARRVARMYRRWAERRRMRFEVLEESGGEGTGGAGAYRLSAAVSGFAAYSILQAEAGLHVLETPQRERSTFNRASAQVRIVAQPEEPAGRAPDALRRQAEAALEQDASAQSAANTIVRRYREEPSPLVRDSVRGWRTGKLERVLDGDFDLFR